MMNLDILDKNIGIAYSEQNMGCLFPAYLLTQNVPKYEFNLDIDYFLPIVKKHCKEINQSAVESGDLLMIKVRQDYHFAIFKEPNLIYHCTKNSKLRLSKIDIYRKYITKVFRFKTDSCMKNRTRIVAIPNSKGTIVPI